MIISTLYAALSFLAESFDRTAQEHMSFSEVLSIQVADDLKALGKKKEETRKKVTLAVTDLCLPCYSTLFARGLFSIPLSIRS